MSSRSVISSRVALLSTHFHSLIWRGCSLRLAEYRSGESNTVWYTPWMVGMDTAHGSQVGMSTG